MEARDFLRTFQFILPSIIEELYFKTEKNAKKTGENRPLLNQKSV